MQNNSENNLSSIFKMEEDIIKNFSINGGQESLEKILSILKFLSKIRESEKIEVKTMNIVKPDYVSRVYRHFISKEDRFDTLHFITTSYSKAIELIYYHLGESQKTSTNPKSFESNKKFNREISKIIINNLEQSFKGVENLIITYSNGDSQKFPSQLESLLESSKLKLSKAKEYLEENKK